MPPSSCRSPAFARDPRLPGTMAIVPSPMAPAAFPLDVNRRLTRYDVAVR